MYHFEHSAPLDTTVYPEPPADDRSGPPLSQGFVTKLVNLVASEHLTPEMQEAIDDMDAEEWYHGQILETLLNHLEDQHPELVVDIGKNIYYSLQHKFMEIGLKKPEDVITTMPMIWATVTRGDSGEWRTKMLAPGKAYVEVQQPYNCQFEKGALQGSLQCFEAQNVVVNETQCMRDGAEFCVFEVTWSE